MSQLNAQDRTAVAYALYDAKFDESWSSDVSEYLIAGYGDFHKDGDFMYPLYVVKGLVVPWEEVKAHLRTEERMSAAQDVFAGFEDLDVIDGDFIKFEGEFYRARYEGPSLFAFVSSDGKYGLQDENGIAHMPISEWNDLFLYDKTFVYEQDQ